jgi:hypothetical protein
MSKDNSQHSIVFTIRKTDHGWFVVLPTNIQLGPYRNAEIALEVAMTHVLLARKRGLDADIFVRDEQGGIHRCMIIDWTNDPDRCQKCESLWRTSGLPVKCPLREAIRRR